MQPAPEGGVDVAGDLVVVAGRASHRIDGASNVFVFDLATRFTGKVVIHGNEILPQFGLHTQQPTQEKGGSQADWLVRPIGAIGGPSGTSASLDSKRPVCESGLQSAHAGLFLY